MVVGCQPVEVWLPGEPGPLDPDVPVDPIDIALVSARSEESGVQACSVPSDRDRLGPFQRRESPGSAASRAYLWSGGILAGDLDNDGFLDVLAPSENVSHLFRGDADARLEPCDQRLAEFDLTMGTGGSVADQDGDGDLDVLILRYEQPAVMLRNEGGGTFSNVSSNMNITTGPTTSSAWGDLDGDGDLDLFIGSYGYLDDESRPARSYLFENAGDGTFYDRSNQLPEILHQGYTRVGGFHDIDGDSFPELYVVNDMGSVAPNILLRNVPDGSGGRRLVADANASGLDLAMSGGGLGVGDVNGDERPDFLIPQWDQISLMVSSETGLWFDHAAASGLRPSGDQRVGWGAELADLDNDGDLDGVVAYGAFEVDIPNWENPSQQPDALFVQDENGNFEDLAPEWGIDDPGKNRGFVVADFDDDGWLDVVKRDLDGPNVLYVSRCGREHWLKVRLSDPGIQNRFAIGARIRVIADDGRHWTRWITAGGTGYGTGGPPEVHFGLADVSEIDRVEIRWPDGSESWVAYGASTDQTVTVFRD